jgi:HD-like signal output (HDOD) protein
MPGMSGLELHEEIARRFPETVRIMLSGQCERQSLLRAVGAVHHFLNKPCEPQTLRFALERAFSLQNWLSTRWQRRLVCGELSIPVSPYSHMRLVCELERPDPSMEQIGRIVSQDAGMAARVLHLVGSGFFGEPRHTADPAEAVELLKLEMVGMLAFSGWAFSPLSIGDSWTPLLERIIGHSLDVARTAAAIAEEEKQDPLFVQHAYLAGLLHESGVLLLAGNLTRRYLEVFDACRLTHTNLWQTETRELGVSHAEIGAAATSLWSVADPVVEAIALHHCPGRSLDRGFSPLTALHVAAVMQNETFTDGVDFAGGIDIDYLHGIGCADRLPQWRRISQTIEKERILQ